MPFKSREFQGNARLDAIAVGGPSLKLLDPGNDKDAVRRIQRALAALVGPMPRSFPNGPSGEPDGVYGSETADMVTRFQTRVFPGDRREWDGRVGRKTLEKLDLELAKGAPAPAATFVCGPDVSAQVADTWRRIQTDFAKLSRDDKIRACDTILIPLKRPGSIGIPTTLEELKHQVRQFADIDGWDTLPLYQGASYWLRHPPVFDKTLNGPCATPSSPDPDADDFHPSHEDDTHCANTVQIGGKCWLNGTVNYGTFGIMVRLCKDFAAGDLLTKVHPYRTAVYSLDWAKMLIRAYKRFGSNPEAAALPVAWTEATYHGGPTATPSVPGNRPKCAPSCGCKGDVVTWDYVWEPVKRRDASKPPSR